VARRAPAELDDFLAPFADVVVEITLLLRDRVLAAMPNAHEVVWDATNAVSLVFTPTRRWQDGICHIAVYTRHANLGFNNGAALDDPRRALEGTGAYIRHIPIRTVEAARETWLDEYLRAAMMNANVTAADGDGGTTVRRSAGKKRRPASRNAR
jgi:hypothetical protein